VYWSSCKAPSILVRF